MTSELARESPPHRGVAEVHMLNDGGSWLKEDP